MIWLGNIIALVASILMVYTGIIKEKKKILLVQGTQIGLSVISNLVLGGITGAIINALSFVRNILCYYDKFELREKITFITLSILLTIRFNTQGWIGYLPLISTVTYISLITIKDVVKFKYLIIFTMVLWAIYDFSIKSYTSGIFDIFTVITNLCGIYLIKTGKKKPAKKRLNNIF